MVLIIKLLIYGIIMHSIAEFYNFTEQVHNKPFNDNIKQFVINKFSKFNYIYEDEIMVLYNSGKSITLEKNELLVLKIQALIKRDNKYIDKAELIDFLRISNKNEKTNNKFIKLCQNLEILIN